MKLELLTLQMTKDIPIYNIMNNIASTTKYDYCFSGILCGLKYARNCIDRKGIPPGPGQGEYPTYLLYFFIISVTFYVVQNLL